MNDEQFLQHYRDVIARCEKQYKAEADATVIHVSLEDPKRFARLSGVGLCIEPDDSGDAAVDAMTPAQDVTPDQPKGRD